MNSGGYFSNFGWIARNNHAIYGHYKQIFIERNWRAMGLLQQQSIGMEISHGGIAAVLLRRTAAKPVLQRVARITLPAETINPTLKAPHVLQPAAFVRTIQKAWGELHQPLHTIALSLPDSAGRLAITTIEEPWKSHDEAAAILRWKLGKRLAIEPDQLQLDFQLLERRLDGATDLLVALIHRNVILQYEELFLEAGLQAAQIGFHTLHLLRLLDRCKVDNGHLVTLYDHSLGTFAQTDNKPVFCRVKQLPATADHVRLLRHELAASLAASRQSARHDISGACTSITSPDDNLLSELLGETLGFPPHQLFTDTLVERDASLSLSSVQLFQTSAALGAAMGND